VRRAIAIEREIEGSFVADHPQIDRVQARTDACAQADELARDEQATPPRGGEKL
jgi:hypothetical protein